MKRAIPNQKPPVSHAHTPANRLNKATPANQVAFARLAKQRKPTPKGRPSMSQDVAPGVVRP